MGSKTHIRFQSIRHSVITNQNQGKNSRRLATGWVLTNSFHSRVRTYVPFSTSWLILNVWPSGRLFWSSGNVIVFCKRIAKSLSWLVINSRFIHSHGLMRYVNALQMQALWSHKFSKRLKLSIPLPNGKVPLLSWFRCTVDTFSRRTHLMLQELCKSLEGASTRPFWQEDWAQPYNGRLILVNSTVWQQWRRQIPCLCYILARVVTKFNNRSIRFFLLRIAFSTIKRVESVEPPSSTKIMCWDGGRLFHERIYARTDKFLFIEYGITDAIKGFPSLIIGRESTLFYLFAIFAGDIFMSDDFGNYVQEPMLRLNGVNENLHIRVETVWENRFTWKVIQALAACSGISAPDEILKPQLGSASNTELSNGASLWRPSKKLHEQRILDTALDSMSLLLENNQTKFRLSRQAIVGEVAFPLPNEEPLGRYLWLQMVSISVTGWLQPPGIKDETWYAALLMKVRWTVMEMQWLGLTVVVILYIHSTTIRSFPSHSRGESSSSLLKNCIV